MTEQMQRGETPVESAETQMLGQPVLELIFALWTGQRQRGSSAKKPLPRTHSVEGLYVLDVLVDKQLQLLG